MPEIYFVISLHRNDGKKRNFVTVSEHHYGGPLFHFALTVGRTFWTNSTDWGRIDYGVTRPFHTATLLGMSEAAYRDVSL